MSLSRGNKLIILDRDGVINEDSDEYIKSVDEWVPIPGSIEAIAELSKAGYTIAVATNQSGLGRGFFDLDDLEAMHEKLASLVGAHGGIVDGIFYCPHTPDDQCDCRKPKPGLINAIENEFNTSVAGCYIVGDSERDLLAGYTKGCRPVLVKTGKGQKSIVSLPKNNPELFSATLVFDDLQHFVKYLLGQA